MDQQLHPVAASIPIDRGYLNVDPAAWGTSSAVTLTVKEVAARYPGFAFRGPGWYALEHGALLLAPAMVRAPGKFVPHAELQRVEGASPTGGVALHAEQLWHVYAFPPFKEGESHAYHALAYLGGLDWAEPPDQPQRELSPGAAIARVSAGILDPLPLEVVLPAGARVVVRPADADGAFAVSYDVRGDGRLTVVAEESGNVCGRAGFIYVEDFHVDASGCLPEEGAPAADFDAAVRAAGEAWGEDPTAAGVPEDASAAPVRTEAHPELRAARRDADAWNAAHPVGTRVRVKRLVDACTVRVAKTTSGAWVDPSMGWVMVAVSDDPTSSTLLLEAVEAVDP